MRKFFWLVLIVLAVLLAYAHYKYDIRTLISRARIPDAAEEVPAANATPETTGPASAFDKNRPITVISRESGSGTRGAFIEIFGIEEKAEDGTQKDMTFKEAVIADKTDIVMTGVAGDPYAIGYISLGSLNDTVKALKIGGVEPSPENMKNETYTVRRPFIIVTKGEASGPVKDFIAFILSKEGQEIVAAARYVGVKEDAPARVGEGAAGKITVVGSSSVTPVMEKLKEAYQAVNPGADIEIHLSDSTAGLNAAATGAADIGMSSRELKEKEKEVLIATPIALDGIAVIVNKENPLVDLTKEQVKDIFTGKIVKWDELIK